MLMTLQSLEPFYEQFDPDFINIRKTVREVLQKEDDLNEIVQLVGKVKPFNLDKPITAFHCPAANAPRLQDFRQQAYGATRGHCRITCSCSMHS